ncbi:N-acetyltransferase family protein [Rhodanobacter lindaniclasticus]
MRERLRARLKHYPWLVWEEAGEVLAYAYAGRFRERAAYDWIAETSIYVHADAQRRGTRAGSTAYCWTRCGCRASPRRSA